MTIPLQITFRNMPPSDAVAAVIEERAAKLARHSGRILRCHVVVDIPHRHHQQGNHYSVRIDVGTRSGPIVVTRETPQNGSHEDFQATLRDAFEAASRRLDAQMDLVRAS
jgi:ribosome-associated translation inhibitor RaiA